MAHRSKRTLALSGKKCYHNPGDKVYANFEQEEGRYWMNGFVTDFKTKSGCDGAVRTYSICFDDNELLHGIHEAWVYSFEDTTWLAENDFSTLTGIEHITVKQSDNKFLRMQGYYVVTFPRGAMTCGSVCHALRLLDDDTVERRGVLSMPEDLHFPQEWGCRANGIPRRVTNGRRDAQSFTKSLSTSYSEGDCPSESDFQATSTSRRVFSDRKRAFTKSLSSSYIEQTIRPSKIVDRKRRTCATAMDSSDSHYRAGNKALRTDVRTQAIPAKRQTLYIESLS